MRDERWWEKKEEGAGVLIYRRDIFRREAKPDDGKGHRTKTEKASGGDGLHVSEVRKPRLHGCT